MSSSVTKPSRTSVSPSFTPDSFCCFSAVASCSPLMSFAFRRSSPSLTAMDAMIVGRPPAGGSALQRAAGGGVGAAGAGDRVSPVTRVRRAVTEPIGRIVRAITGSRRASSLNQRKSFPLFRSSLRLGLVHPRLDLQRLEDAELRLHLLPPQDGDDETVELSARVEVDARLVSRHEGDRPHEVEGRDDVLEPLRDRTGGAELLVVAPDRDAAGEVELLHLVRGVPPFPGVLLEPNGREVPRVDPGLVARVHGVEPRDVVVRDGREADPVDGDPVRARLPARWRASSRPPRSSARRSCRRASPRPRTGRARPCPSGAPPVRGSGGPSPRGRPRAARPGRARGGRRAPYARTRGVGRLLEEREGGVEHDIGCQAGKAGETGIVGPARVSQDPDSRPDRAEARRVGRPEERHRRRPRRGGEVRRAGVGADEEGGAGGEAGRGRGRARRRERRRPTRARDDLARRAPARRDPSEATGLEPPRREGPAERRRRGGIPLLGRTRRERLEEREGASGPRREPRVDLRVPAGRRGARRRASSGSPACRARARRGRGPGRRRASPPGRRPSRPSRGRSPARSRSGSRSRPCAARARRR